MLGHAPYHVKQSVVFNPAQFSRAKACADSAQPGAGRIILSTRASYDGTRMRLSPREQVK